MTNSKSTKRALVVSALAILLCVTMLIGTTFAWFTDTKKTEVNTIKSGTLTLALEMQNADGSWTDATVTKLEFKKAAGHESEEILWEPGCTYELPKLRITNTGTLALKYKVVITGIDGNAELNDVIDWTIDDTVVGTDIVLESGDQKEFTIKGHMQETASNHYQGMEITGISITVYATQATVEYDSERNTYDENAQYNDAAYVEAADASAFNDGTVFINSYLQSDAHVVLKDDIVLDKSITLQSPDTKLSLDLNGHKLTVPQIILNNASTVVISDSVGTGEIDFSAQNGINAAYAGANVVMNGGTLKASSDYKIYSFTVEKEGSVVMLSANGSSFVMNGGTIIADNDRSDVPGGSMAVRLYGSDTTFIMNGGEIVKNVGTLAAIQASGSGSTVDTKIEINAGSIKSNSVAIYHPQNGTLTVNDGYIEGETAIYAKSGTLLFNGGTMHATAATATDYTYMPGGMMTTGDAVVIDACGYPGGNPNVTIAGGSYTVTAADAHGFAYYKYNSNTATIVNTAGIEVYEK